MAKAPPEDAEAALAVVSEKTPSCCVVALLVVSVLDSSSSDTWYPHSRNEPAPEPLYGAKHGAAHDLAERIQRIYDGMADRIQVEKADTN
jgi:hypothetical protein